MGSINGRAGRLRPGARRSSRRIGTLAIFRSFLVEYSHAVPITTNNCCRSGSSTCPALSLFNIGEIEFRALFADHDRRGDPLPADADLPAVRPAPLCDRLQPGRRPDRRLPCAAHRVPGVRRLSGALAGLAGFMFLGRFGNITVLAGTGLEFSVDRGGRGRRRQQHRRLRHGGRRVPGRAASSTCWRRASSAGRPISEFWRDAILGMLILLAVALDYVVFGRLKNLWAAAGCRCSTDDSRRRSRRWSTDVR